ncbi:helix-turn-helix domain-containing protein [Bacillus pumilus]
MYIEDLQVNIMFGNRLKELRKLNKKTQDDLANLLGISRQGYSRYEKNETQPDFDSLKKLSNFFNVSIDYLLTGKEFDGSNEEMWKELLNPKTQLFFKDLKDAPDDKIEELIQFWEFIKNKK